MRRPVVASSVGGVPEIVREGETGWTIENSKYDEWVARIRMIVEDESLRKKIGTEAKEWVTENFGWPTIGKQVEHLITSALSR